MYICMYILVDCWRKYGLLNANVFKMETFYLIAQCFASFSERLLCEEVHVVRDRWRDLLLPLRDHLLFQNAGLVLFLLRRVPGG
jgi:hypothetical protein